MPNKNNDDKEKKDRKQYFKEYFEKNKNKLTKDIICDVCGGKYQKMNQTIHFNSKKHKTGLEMQKIKEENERMKNIFGDINKKIEKI